MTGGAAPGECAGEPVVSRETLARLRNFLAFAQKVNARVNLFGKDDTERLWERHIVDSLQIFRHAPPSPQRWADLGTGGGFPGLVLAIAATEISPGTAFTLVESDLRKAEFLREAAARHAPRTTVLAQRIEAVAPLDATVVSARALAPLLILLGYVQRHLSKGGVALLSKGAQADAEIAEAQTSWKFRVVRAPSMTGVEAVVLKVDGIERA